jgi:outer membrane protein OmpA-like peptidoglycan-associated protein
LEQVTRASVRGRKSSFAVRPTRANIAAMPTDDPSSPPGSGQGEFDPDQTLFFKRRKREVNLLPLVVVCVLVLGSGALIVWAVSQSGNRRVDEIVGKSTPDPFAGRPILAPDQVRSLANPPVSPPTTGAATTARAHPAAGFDTSKPVRAAVPVIAGAEPPPATAVADASNSAPLNFDPDDPSNAAVRAEVLRRIDAMPGVSATNKDKLYGRVDHARGMGRVLTIPFEKGESTVRPATVDKMKAQLADPRFKPLLDDPTVVFVVLGYADQKGNDKVNSEISLTRARSVVDAMRDKCGLLNVMHAVAMGGSTLFSAKEADKNRVAEIWAVVP